MSTTSLHGPASGLRAAVLALLAAPCAGLAISGCGAARADAPLEISTTVPDPARGDDPLVDVSTWDPRIQVRAVYATPDNFVGEALYPLPRILLRRTALVRLSRVQDALEEEGLGLLVFDGYRPWSVTKRMWDVIGDPDYVADPARGSRHNRGMAVDVTLVDAQGRALPMPTAFDAFVPEAASDAEVDPPGGENRDRLIAAMAAEGFAVLSSEWWHFDADGWRDRALLDVALPDVPVLPASEGTRAGYRPGRGALSPFRWTGR